MLLNASGMTVASRRYGKPSSCSHCTSASRLATSKKIESRRLNMVMAMMIVVAMLMVMLMVILLVPPMMTMSDRRRCEMSVCIYRQAALINRYK